MNEIPNELSYEFVTEQGRKRLIELYGENKGMFHGKNSDGETVFVSIDSNRGIVLKTYQENGWIRINCYDKEGCIEDECFDGKWKESLKGVSK